MLSVRLKNKMQRALRLPGLFLTPKFVSLFPSLFTSTGEETAALARAGSGHAEQMWSSPNAQRGLYACSHLSLHKQLG